VLLGPHCLWNRIFLALIFLIIRVNHRPTNPPVLLCKAGGSDSQGKYILDHKKTSHSIKIRWLSTVKCSIIITLI
jgi:hypothetical protein